jgi:quercetin dioxygenase-like cupin family protein
MTHTELDATPAPLADLVAYQDDAIVSRTLLGKKAGTVTLFAFGAGQGLSEHSTPFDALLLVVEGAMEVTISGTPHALEAGDLLRLPADEPHAVHTAEPSKMLLVMIREA